MITLVTLPKLADSHPARRHRTLGSSPRADEKLARISAKAWFKPIGKKSFSSTFLDFVLSFFAKSVHNKLELPQAAQLSIHFFLENK